MAGVILDSVARGRTEQKRVHYLSISPSRGEKTSNNNTTRLHERRAKKISEGVNSRQTTQRAAR